MYRRALTYILVIMFAVSCVRQDAAKEDIYYSHDKAIDDSLSAGRMDGAMRLIEQGQREAEDSDAYYHYESRKAAADYYMARPDSLMVHSGRAIKYYAAQPETPRRLKDYSSTLQTRSSYFQNFVFDSDSALSYQTRALDLAHRSAIKCFYAIALANTGDVYRQNGDYVTAADKYRQAIMLADSLELQKTEYVPMYSGLASVYTGLHNFKQSDIWWRRTEELWPVMMESEKFFFLNNRGHDLYLKGDYEASLKVFEKLSDFLTTQPSMDWERHFCSANISDVLIKLGRGDEARELIAGNLDYFSKVQPNPYVYAHVMIQKLNLLHHEGKNAMVEQLLLENPIKGNAKPDQYMDRLEFLKDIMPTPINGRRL